MLVLQMENYDYERHILLLRKSGTTIVTTLGSGIYNFRNDKFDSTKGNPQASVLELNANLNQGIRNY